MSPPKVIPHLPLSSDGGLREETQVVNPRLVLYFATD
jgi:hypothetical protein